MEMRIPVDITVYPTSTRISRKAVKAALQLEFEGLRADIMQALEQRGVL